MTIIKRGGSTSELRFGIHGVPAFLSGQQNIGTDAVFATTLMASVHGVARRGRGSSFVATVS